MNENIGVAAPASGAPDLPTGHRADEYTGDTIVYGYAELRQAIVAALAQAAPASPPAAADAGALSYEDAFNAAWAETSKLNRISPGAPPSPKFIEWFRAGWDARPTASGATPLVAPASPASAPVAPEPSAPHILEALSYHERERDDLTLEDAVEAFRNGYKKVAQRDDRAMLAQIIHLLASAPAVKVEAQQAGVVEAWQQNYELVIARLERISQSGGGSEFYAWAEEALVCARALAAPLPPVVARKVLTDDQIEAAMTEVGIFAVVPLMRRFARAIERHLMGGE